MVDKDKKNESVQKWRANQISKGKCRYCKKKALKGITMCRYHRDYNLWHKRLYEKDKVKKK